MSRICLSVAACDAGIAWVLAACPAMGQASAPAAKVVGWRGDGTGLFPDATPVVEWGRWPKSPNHGLRYQTRRPAADDAEQNAKPVQSGQVLEWLVVGPFAGKDPAAVLEEDLLPGEAAATPNEGDKAGTLAWARHVSVNKESGVAMDWIQLAELAGKKPGTVVYAHNYFHSAVKGTVALHLDHTAGCKVWVNGKVVHNNPKPAVTMFNINYVCYAATTHWAGELPVLGEGGSPRIAVELDKGWNRVLIKSGGNVNLRLVEAPQAEYETKNVIWATGLPNYSNAQPIIVGDRIFLMSESEDLICLDQATGRILWRRPTYYSDCLSEQEKQASPSLKQAAELTDKLRTATDSDERIKLRNEIKKALAAADKDAATADPRYA
jgi:hypothetical protein